MSENRMVIAPVRIGNGYDVHAFKAGAGLTLCGVYIPFDYALDGHSDADVGMHAITDALLGALALGDIGHYFPSSDPQWQGARSEIFLRHAVKCVHDRKYYVGNIDCTLICETPKIGIYRAQMQACLANIMEIEETAVSVKATTTEGLGFAGRKEGIAAFASATIWLR